MDRLVVDFAALGGIADQLAREAERTEELLTGLERQVEKLRTEWEGSAADGFAVTFDTWSRAARDLHEQLRRIRDLTVTAHGNHARAVQINVRIWQA